VVEGTHRPEGDAAVEPERVEPRGVLDFPQAFYFPSRSLLISSSRPCRQAKIASM
jgi:hypothetical protein